MPSPIDNFLSTYDRSQNLLGLYKRLRGVKLKKEPQRFYHDDISDLLRSSIALAVSAMDAYFTAKFIEATIFHLRNKKITKGLSDLLQKAGLTPEMSIELIQMERPYRRIRTILKNHLSDYTSQRFKKINDLFKTIGLNGLCENAGKKSKRKQLLRSVELLVLRRHAIVHSGDLNSHGKLTKLHYEETRKRIEDLKLFVSNCEAIINNAMR